MRLVAGSAMISRGFNALQAGPPIESAALDVIGIIAGILLLAGLWTPLSGSLLAVLGIWSAISQPGDPWSEILLGTIGAGLALVGPGAWSVDARLFGWKRIDVRDRES
jgi:uncharacterized membrane protein YphA (DoxX/SURF4 family)